MGHERVERGERRWQTLGMIGGTLLILVAHTVEFEELETEIISIISARRAEPKEKRRYEKARQENREQ